MAKGKNTCKILKEIRKQIAEDNDIELIIEECTYKGDCEGTCPRCEEEVRFLEEELEKRQKEGKKAVLGGRSLQETIKASTKGKPKRRPLLGRVKPTQEPDEESYPDDDDLDPADDKYLNVLPGDII